MGKQRAPGLFVFAVLVSAACPRAGGTPAAPGFRALSLLSGQLGGGGSLDAAGAAARFSGPQGLAADGAGNLYVSDGSHLRKVVIATGAVTTLARPAPAWLGKEHLFDKPGVLGLDSQPTALAYDSAGYLYFIDGYYNLIGRLAVATGALSVLAGDGVGDADGVGTAASFHSPSGLAYDGAGNLYVADTINDSIRKVVVATGAVTTLAGSSKGGSPSDGVGTAARFGRPIALTYDGAGVLYVVDSFGAAVRRVEVKTGVVTTLAGSHKSQGDGEVDGVGAAARFFDPRALAYDGIGGLYLIDVPAVHTVPAGPTSYGTTLRRIDVATGAVSTLAGSPKETGRADGVGGSARFARSEALAYGGAGTLFVADSQNTELRKVVLATGAVTTLAGAAAAIGTADGAAGSTSFKGPEAVVDDGAGNLFVADRGNHTIREIAVATGAVRTLAGSPGVAGAADGSGTAARFNEPAGLAYDGAGTLYVADYNNNLIRKIAVATGAVSTVAGSRNPKDRSGDLPAFYGTDDGPNASAKFSGPVGLAYDGAGSLYVADRGNDALRRIDLGTQMVSTLAGHPYRQTSYGPACGSSDGIGRSAEVCKPDGLAYDRAGYLYVADTCTIRKVGVATWLGRLGIVSVTTVAGTPYLCEEKDGVGKEARFDEPAGLAYDGAGTLYVSDRRNGMLRKIALETGAVTTIAGKGGQVGVALGELPAGLNKPAGLALGPGPTLFVSDGAENAILQVK